MTVRSVSEPNRMLGAFGRAHLAYELLVNRTRLRLDQAETADDSGQNLSSREGDASGITIVPRAFSFTAAGGI
jgi:hypothetical protein